MSTAQPQLLMQARPEANIRVARFLQPDNRTHLDYGENKDIERTGLYGELRATVLRDLTPGDTVVLNLGLVDWFISAFFSLLLQADKEVTAAGGRLLICCFPAFARESFGLMGGEKQFAGRVFEQEKGAVDAAKRRPA